MATAGQAGTARDAAAPEGVRAHFRDGFRESRYGAEAFDALAAFLERYYLLQAGAPVVILLILGHILLATRKLPTAFAQQWAAMRHIRAMRHLDTTTWALQALSGAGILALAAIHLWTVLTDVPLEAAKSGARVFGVYLWLYIPFLVLVEGHISVGVYRVAMKWGLLSRRFAHPVLVVWTAMFLALGVAILVALYRIGGSQ